MIVLDMVIRFQSKCGVNRLPSTPGYEVSPANDMRGRMHCHGEERTAL